MTDIVEHIGFLRSWAADIRKSSGMSVDADRLDAIALALSETEDNTLLSYLADIRQKSGVGIKPMLSELADTIATALSEARATGRREGLSEAAEILLAKAEELRANENPTSTAMAMIFEEQATAIRAAMEKEE